MHRAQSSLALRKTLAATAIVAATSLVLAGARLHNAAVPAATAAQPSRWSLVDQDGGVTRAVAWDGRWLYLGVGPRLYVVGRCGIPEPNVVGRTGVMSAIVRDVVVDGDRAWVALGPAGVAAVDVSNLADPREGPPTSLPGVVADVPGEALALALAGDRLWVAGTAGVHVVDVAGDAPRVVAHATGPGGQFGGPAFDIAVDEGGRAVVAWGAHGLRVLEVAGGAIRELGRDPRDDWFAEALDVADGIAWVAGQGNSLRAIDVSDPARPRERSQTAFTVSGGQASDIAVAAENGWVSIAFFGVDVQGREGVRLHTYRSDGDAPRGVLASMHPLGLPTVGEEWVGGSGIAVAIAWPWVVVAADRYGLGQYQELSRANGGEGTEPVDDPVWFVPIPPVESMASGRHGVWLAAGPSGALPLDAGTTGYPRSHWDWTGARDVAVLDDGATALVAGEELKWVGAGTGSERAAILLTLFDARGLERVAADADLAVAAGREQGFVVVEAPSGQDPAIRAVLPVVDPTLGFAVLPRGIAVDASARRAALVDGNWLHLFDLTDRAAPRRVATLEIPGGIGVALAGERAWVASELGELVGVDIGRPAEPRIVATGAGLAGAVAVAVVDDRAFVALGVAGVAVVRLGDAPAVEAIVDTPGAAIDVARAHDEPGGGVWVADREGGVVLVADIAGLPVPVPTPVPLPTSCPLPPGTLLLPFAAREHAGP